MRLAVVFALVCCAAGLSIAKPAFAQMLGPDCRPLPMPGYMMSPQPPDPNCLRAQAQAAEAARRRQQAAAAAAAAAREKREAENQQRLAALGAQCATATVEQVRETVEQDPMIANQPVKVLDVTAPQFTAAACRTQILTTQGVLNGVLEFRDFNGKTFLLVHMTPERASK